MVQDGTTEQQGEPTMIYSETGNMDKYDHTAMLDGRFEPATVCMSMNKDTNFFENYIVSEL